jgi:hypothetical protein
VCIYACHSTHTCTLAASRDPETIDLRIARRERGAPLRGHPVFVAQHPYMVDVICRWIELERAVT